MSNTLVTNYNPNLETQTYKSILMGAYRQIWALLELRSKQANQSRRDRKVFLQLLELEDELLADIGISRADVIWASKLPAGINASRELENIAHQNRKSN